MSGSSAAQITKRSKSNLAFALRCLPKERREDMVTFYAFCRIVDDLADEPDGSKEEREERPHSTSLHSRGNRPSANPRGMRCACTLSGAQLYAESYWRDRDGQAEPRTPQC